MRLVHVSDLHFGAVSPLLPEALKSAILAAKPEVLVVSGDLTQRGRASEVLFRLHPFAPVGGAWES